MSKMVKYPDGSIREISDGKNIKKVKDVLIFMIDENDDIFIQRKKE